MKNPSKPPRAARRGRVRTKPSGRIAASRPGSSRRTGSAAAARRRQDSTARVFALFGLQRAGGIDQPSAGRQHVRRGGQQPRLHCGQAVDVGLGISGARCRVAADGSGRAAGRVQQNRVDRCRRPPGGRIGGDDLGGHVQTVQVLLQPFQARAGPVDRGHPRRRRRQAAPSCRRVRRRGRPRCLPAMSPNRRAGRAAAASCTHQAPVGEAGKRAHVARLGQAQRPGRQHRARPTSPPSVPASGRP